MITAIVLCIAAAEGLLRSRYKDIARITGISEWQTAEWQGLTYHWDEYHPRYGWTNRPGYRSGESIPFKVSINGQGLRGAQDYAPHPAPGTRRIMLFGDSLAFGEDVDDMETVSHYLGRSLTHTEVLNFGVHGYGLGQMMLRLEDEAFALHPDHILVMLMLPRDIWRDLQRDFVHAKPVFGLRDGELAIDNLPVPIVSEQPWLHRNSFIAAFLFARATTEVAPEAPDLPTRVGQALLWRIQSRAAAEGISLTLVNVSNGNDLRRLNRKPEERSRLNAMRAALTLPELDVLDLIDFLEERTLAEGRALVTKNWHWSPRGNCLIAAKIAQHLNRINPVWSLRPDGQACLPDLLP